MGLSVVYRVLAGRQAASDRQRRQQDQERRLSLECPGPQKETAVRDPLWQVEVGARRSHAKPRPTHPRAVVVRRRPEPAQPDREGPAVTCPVSTVAGERVAGSLTDG